MSSSQSHGKAKTSAVPKFTSFRPKAPPENAQASVGEPIAADKPPKVESRHADSHRRRRSRSTERGAISKSDRLPVSVGAQLPTEQRSGEDVLYIFDKRGDPLIRRYGGNDRRSIPVYRRVGAGRVLGHDGFMRIERVGNREEFYFAGGSESRALLSSDRKSLLAKGIRPDRPSIRVRSRAEETGVATAEDFLPLKSSSRKRKREGLGSDRSSDEEGPSYRSIHGKSKNHEHSDSDDVFDSDASDDALLGRAGDPVTVRSIELSRKVREQPEDVESWLELVDHQDNLLSVQSAGRAPTAAEIRSFADIKLSLLEQALSHCTDDVLREKLNLKVMAEGVKVWELKTAQKKFNEILQKYPKSFELWKLYISFLQTTLSVCSYEEIKKLYTEKLQSLQRELTVVEATEDQLRCSEQIIYVFLRLTRFLADTGFVELAAAAWQATLELNLARPPTRISDDAGAGVPPSFQDYWESEVPRLGEAEWKGWTAFIADSHAQDPPAPKTTNTPPVTPNTRDGYKAWYTVEYQKSRDAAVPARTLDEGAEDDPFRVVMYSDVQDILLYFPTSLIPSIRRQLLDAFLVFSHLPPSAQTDGVIREALNDPFLVRSLQTVPFANLSATTYADQPEEQQSRSPEFHYGIQEMSLTTDVLFPSAGWFRYMGKMRGIVSPDHYQWVAATLKQITRMGQAGELGPYALAFESINEPGNEKKSAKALLKLDPSNVDLYLGYSILEYERGNKAAALNVLSAAYNLPLISAHDRVRLGIAAAWHELKDGELAKAVLQLCRLTEEGTGTGTGSSSDPVNKEAAATPAQILKARQFLATNRDYKISSGEVAQAVIYAEALALLEYLTKRSEKEPRAKRQGDILSAITSIDQCSQDLVSRGHGRSASHERFLQFAARLMYYHASHGSFRPGLFREQMLKYLASFPHNTIFLSLFAWRSERRLSVNDRVRALLQDLVLSRRNETESSSLSFLASHVFAISHELETGTAHSARAAFERALVSTSCAGNSNYNYCSSSTNVGLWISYIRLCHLRRELRGSSSSSSSASKDRDRDKDRENTNTSNTNTTNTTNTTKSNTKSSSKAKDVFYRAIQACPYSKDVFMEAFGTLVRDMDSAELRTVYETMCQKGFRVHVDLDEFVDVWRRKGQKEQKGR